ADRFVPAPGAGSALGVEGAAVPAELGARFAASAGFASRPLTLANALTGAPVSRPVAGVATLDLSAEVGLTARFAVGIGELNARHVTFVGELGYRVSPPRTLLETRFGSELHAGLGVIAHGPRRLAFMHAMAEIETLHPGPTEARGGLRATFRGFAVDVGA